MFYPFVFVYFKPMLMEMVLIWRKLMPKNFMFYYEFLTKAIKNLINSSMNIWRSWRKFFLKSKTNFEWNTNGSSRCWKWNTFTNLVVIWKFQATVMTVIKSVATVTSVKAIERFIFGSIPNSGNISRGITSNSIKCLTRRWCCWLIFYVESRWNFWRSIKRREIRLQRFWRKTKTRAKWRRGGHSRENKEETIALIRDLKVLWVFTSCSNGCQTVNKAIQTLTRSDIRNRSLPVVEAEAIPSLIRSIENTRSDIRNRSLPFVEAEAEAIHVPVLLVVNTKTAIRSQNLPVTERSATLVLVLSATKDVATPHHAPSTDDIQNRDLRATEVVIILDHSPLAEETGIDIRIPTAEAAVILDHVLSVVKTRTVIPSQDLLGDEAVAIPDHALQVTDTIQLVTEAEAIPSPIHDVVITIADIRNLSLTGATTPLTVPCAIPLAAARTICLNHSVFEFDFNLVERKKKEHLSVLQKMQE